MATTQTEICNLALSLIGNEGNQVTDFDTDTGKTARQCRLHYQRTLEELLRVHTWNCSKERVELTTIAYTGFGWSYESDLPADCIRPIFVTSSDSAGRYYNFTSEWTVQGRKILSTSESNFLVYIKEPTVATMDSLFIQAFYTLLAIKLSIPIAGPKNTIRMELLNEFHNVILPEARRVNGFEGHEEAVIDSDWIEATYSTSGFDNRYSFNENGDGSITQ